MNSFSDFFKRKHKEHMDKDAESFADDLDSGEDEGDISEGEDAELENPDDFLSNLKGKLDEVSDMIEDQIEGGEDDEIDKDDPIEKVVVIDKLPSDLRKKALDKAKKMLSM